MIDLLPSDEQIELIGWANSIVGRELDPPTLLKNDRHSYDIGGFVAKLGELGFFGLSENEEAGGGGLSYGDDALVYRELGRYIAPGPLVSTLLAGRAARLAGDDAAAHALLTGQAMAILAERRIDGRVVMWDAGDANEVLLVDERAATADRYPRASFDEIEPVASIDPYHCVGVAAAPTMSDRLSNLSGAPASTLIGHGRLLAAAYLAGLAEGARDHSAAYSKERVQFGRPIGTFQAVKHRCADTAVRAEAAWAQTIVAALRLTSVGAVSAAVEVAVAKITAGEAAVRNARDNIQNHGGIGYTFESAAHLFLKRAHVYSRTFGEARELRTLVLEGAESW